MNKHYELEYVKFNLKGDYETIVIITGENSYGLEVKIAQYDFRDTGYKFYYDLKGNKKEVARFSTIMNYLFKQKEYLGWDDRMVNTAKDNAKRLKLEEKKARKEEKKALQLEKVEEYLQLLNDNNEKVVEVISNTFMDQSDKEIFDTIKNNFNLVSETVQFKVFYAIKDKINELTAPTNNDDTLTDNEKEVISTRLTVDPSYLNNSIFTVSELKDEKVIHLINKHVNMLVNDRLEKDNINLTNKNVTEWTKHEKEMFRYYFDNFMFTILDGSLLDTVNAIRSEYKEMVAKKEMRMQEENDFNSSLDEVAVTIEDIQDITDNNEQIEVSYTIFNHSFNTYDEALQYCNDNDFSPEYIERVDTIQPSTTQTIEDEKEIFYFYNQSFNTYSEAFNHAINNMSPVTMILSSKHPTMNNERLKQLEYSYTFDKMKMAYDDMKEYFEYISSCPVTMDQEDRYYKLKSWISRYKNRMASIEATKQDRLQLAQKSSELLEYMVNNGLELKELGSMVIYYYQGEKVHSWISGISIEEYAQGIEKVYNTHFKHLQLV